MDGFARSAMPEGPSVAAEAGDWGRGDRGVKGIGIYKVHKT